MKLRLPEALRQQIFDAAEVNRRSMNAEIVARLEASFGQASMGRDARDAFVASRYDRELGDRFQALMDRYEELIRIDAANRGRG